MLATSAIMIGLACLGQARGDVKKPDPAKSAPAPAKLPAGLPEYTVLYTGPQVRGGGKPMGRRGDVLIKSLTRKTDPAELEAIGRAILKKEGYHFATFYRTEEAYKANESATYLKAHPRALVDGFLGAIGGSLTDPGITEGVWQSADELFPEPKQEPKAKAQRKIGVNSSFRTQRRQAGPAEISEKMN